MHFPYCYLPFEPLVPSQPLAPKVYVTQRKSGASSKLTLAADFRWTEPSDINGVLSHQHVIFWKSSNQHAISSTTLSASARHFILDGLEGNTTYFFQVKYCISHLLKHNILQLLRLNKIEIILQIKQNWDHFADLGSINFWIVWLGDKVVIGWFFFFQTQNVFAYQ